MKIKDMIAELLKLDQELEIVMSKDEEGNGYSPLPENFYSIGYYQPENTWSGEFYTQQDIDDEFGDVSKSVKAIAIFPTN